MRSITVGDSIVLDITIRDSDGVLHDPVDLRLDIVRSGSVIVYGPFTYGSGELTRISTGQYRYLLTIEEVVTPGIFTAKWTYQLDGDTQLHLENFQALDSLPVASTIQDAPRRYGIIRESSLYQTMGIGLTDRIFLIGHADGLPLNSPYEVRDMRETINVLGGDADSPLVRGLLECYNAGCRDMWLVQAAPMTEYVEFDPANEENRFTPNDEWGGLNFYERYAQRLETTYSMLLDYDLPEIMVPLEAPFYDTRGVDFLTPLIEHCNNQFALSGSPVIGVIGTRIINPTSEDVVTMATDSRLGDIGVEGKFVMVTVGEGIFRLKQMPSSYRGSLAASSAAALSTKPLDRGMAFGRLQTVLNLVGRDMIDAEIAQITNAGLNPAIRTKRGKRGEPYQVVLATDNALGYGENTDFYSIMQVRIVSKVISTVRALSNRRIGTIGFANLKADIGEYLNSLSLNGLLRGHSFNMMRDPLEPTKALVDISLKPFFGLREISFTIEVGPGA